MPAAQAQRQVEGPAAGDLSAQQGQAQAQAVQGRPTGDAGDEKAWIRQRLGPIEARNGPKTARKRGEQAMERRRGRGPKSNIKVRTPPL